MLRQQAFLVNYIGIHEDLFQKIAIDCYRFIEGANTEIIGSIL